MTDVPLIAAPAAKPSTNGSAPETGFPPDDGPRAGNGGDPLLDHAPVGPPGPPGPAPEEEALAELGRVLTAALLKAAAWGVGTSLRVSGRLARVAADPDLAGELYTDMTSGMRSYAREFLGIVELDEQVRELTLLAGIPMRRSRGARAELELRTRGAALLREAAGFELEDSAHPAYARILTELAPDEARILRLLVRAGPQPLVDVRAGNLIGLGSQLIARGLNMLGAEAGLQHRERVPIYLDNLRRLGLTFVAEEPLGGPATYQVLEAQPEVLGTLRETPRAKTVRRSICLSAFGQDFCDVCLPLGQPDPG